MVARARDGTVVTYPLTVTEQRDSMCHTVVAPAPVAASVSEQALAVARKAISSLWGAGIFGVELFHMKDGSVLLNEIAPRPHNSGHYTMDACVTEQHEMHLRCVAGLPLGDTSMKVAAAAMYNVIGSADGKLSTTLAAVDAALAMPCAALHWYGKAPPKPRRKMAHVNLVGGSRHEVAIALRKLEAIADAANGVEGAVAPSAPADEAPVVSIIMGSDSDLPCMKAAAEVLEQFGVPYEITIVSAHRTPSRCTSLRARRTRAACASSSPARAARLTCQAWSPR